MTQEKFMVGNYRSQFNGLRPEEISYNKNDGTLVIRSSTFPVENPKLAFIKALEEFQVVNTYNEYSTGTRVHVDTRIGDDVEIGCNCTIGGHGFGYEYIEGEYKRIPHLGDVLIEDNVCIHNNVNIDRSVTGTTIIGNGAKIDSGVHIGHNAKIGKNVLIAAGASIGGSAIIGEKVFIGCNAIIKQKLKIGAGAVIGAGSVVLHDVPDGQTWVGNPAKQLIK
jgi:UDP-3-O-[3-hydroxymyristoyl] glucosamine N-acyltransferase